MLRRIARNEFGASAAFNQPIGNWDVSSVAASYCKFDSNEAFNQPIGNWDVSTVNVIHDLFDSNDAFNQPIDNWDVSAVVTDGFSMFDSSEAFGDVSARVEQPRVHWFETLAGDDRACRSMSPYPTLQQGNPHPAQ